MPSTVHTIRGRGSGRARTHSEVVEHDLEVKTENEVEVSDEESQSKRRRRSSRYHAPVNYSDKRKHTKHVTNGDSLSDAHDHNHEILTENGYIEDTQGLLNHQRRSLSKVDQLAKLSVKHSLLTQELFHLKEFTSLATWDPSQPPAKWYESFVIENYNLWEDKDNVPKDKPLRGKRHSLRTKPNTDPLMAQVEEAQGLFHDETFNPTKYYYDHFLVKTERKGRKSIIIKPSESKKLAKVKPKTPMTGPKIEEINDQDVNLVESEVDIETPEPYIPDGQPIPKIKIRLALPPQTITNPDHVSRPEFGSLEAYLKSYKSLEEDIPNEEYEEYIHEQKGLMLKLRRAINNNVLKVDEKLNFAKASPPQPYRDPLKTMPTHHDHLVGQAIHLSRLFQDSRKARISRQRKIAQMIEVHFKRQAGADERARKEEERRLKALARNAVQAVKKRWLLAERAYRVLRNKEAEELKRIKGKEHLSQMLEHSSQLLEAQLTKQTDDELDDDDDIDDADDDDDDDVDVDGSNRNKGKRPSTAELHEDIKKLEETDDADLTVEELKAKYAHLQGMKFDDVSEVDVATGTDVEDGVVHDNEAETETEVPELTEQEKAAIDQANREDRDDLLDSDTSLDSDEESDISSEEESDLAENEGEGKTSGLAALFSKSAADFDEDDEEPASYSESGIDNDDADSDNASIVDDKNKEISTSSSTPDIETKKKSSTAPENEGVVDVPTPTQLLRGNLRYYQKQGLNWLASLYNNGTNGILADEMGLGKTIQTISLISYLAVSKGNWGPHLIVVPTSVLLNWEMEFKRFAPGFKLMVYYGSPQQRKEKRKGWNRPDTFHVCITSYQLVCQDQQIFKRKRWKYMILDEAHNIKNFKSNRWNALLNFNTENRLLLTGTPLQNNIMELWSLLYFLMPSTKSNQSMPSGFANLDDFQQWFGKPVHKIIEGGVNQEVDKETKQTVSKLHQVLRPYLLRRLKADVESQMPGKYEHIVYCRLSKRQYKLYHEYLARSDTKQMLKNANYISIINALMQLRKVCNHPDLFEERQITTSFAVEESLITPYEVTNSKVLKLLNSKNCDREINLSVLNLNFGSFEKNGLTTYHAETINSLKSSKLISQQVEMLSQEITDDLKPSYHNIVEFYKFSTNREKQEVLEKLKQSVYLNDLRCDKFPVYGANLIKFLTTYKPVEIEGSFKEDFIKPLKSRILSMNDEVDRFAFVTPEVRSLNLAQLTVSKPLAVELTSRESQLENPFHKLQTKLSIQFPDKSLLLYDCGKLQKLAKLLQDLKDGGHRALIFTQMTKVLDVLEQFLNIMGIRYMRLDGATKIEDRQVLTERFNSDPKIMVFILSTRSGGLGINLTGADTVIFYDSDWNPAMDKQCQDRCHRIGQTRDVHIYRFVSEYTIESNILKKANQKRHLDNVIIQEGEFTTDYFSRLSVKDLLGGNGDSDADLDDSKPLFQDASKLGNVLAQAEDAADAQAAKEAMKEVEVDNEDFEDEVEGGKDEDDREKYGHIDEYMIRFIANGYYYD